MPEPHALDPPRWWRHPALVVALHAQATAIGLAAAAPIAARVAEAVGSFAGVDATLFDGGGVLLAELLRVTGPDGLAVALPGLVVVLLGLVLGLLATAALLDAMAEPLSSPLVRLRRALAVLPAMVALLLLATSAKLALVGLGWTMARPLVDLAATGTPDRAAAACVAAALLAGSVSLVSVLHDLARAALAGGRAGFFDSLALAARTLRGEPAALFVAFALRGATSALLLLSAALLAFRVGMRASTSAWISQSALELALLFATCLRASWLGIALRAVLRPAAGTALPDDDDSSRNSLAAPR